MIGLSLVGLPREPFLPAEIGDLLIRLIIVLCGVAAIIFLRSKEFFYELFSSAGEVIADASYCFFILVVR